MLSLFFHLFIHLHFHVYVCIIDTLFIKHMKSLHLKVHVQQHMRRSLSVYLRTQYVGVLGEILIAGPQSGMIHPITIHFLLVRPATVHTILRDARSAYFNILEPSVNRKLGVVSHNVDVTSEETCKKRTPPNITSPMQFLKLIIYRYISFYIFYVTYY